jgi:hypothetical protein
MVEGREPSSQPGAPSSQSFDVGLNYSTRLVKARKKTDLFPRIGYSGWVSSKVVTRSTTSSGEKGLMM